MAEEMKVAETEPLATYRTYPWVQWTNGSVWTVHYPEDIGMEAFTFRIYLYTKASKWGVAVSASLLDPDTLRFQFRDAGTPPVKLPGAPRRGRPVDGTDPALVARAAAFRATQDAKRKEAALVRARELLGGSPTSDEVSLTG